MSNHELVVDSVIVQLGERQILSDIYLHCLTGEVVGILGRNGSGKSTLLKVIFGTLDTANKSIRIDGKVYAKPYLTGGLIAYLPQHGFLPTNIHIRNIIRLYADENAARKAILEDKQLQPHLNKTTKELSGGQLRYFEILLLLSLKAKFVLLDEPFMGIEPIYQEKIKDLIIENKSSRGFIITDHHYRNVMEVSDRIISLSKGKTSIIQNAEELEDINYVPKGTFTRREDIASQEPEMVNANTRFEMDEQTYKDLEASWRSDNNAFLTIFNSTRTAGARSVLEEMLKSPSNDVRLLERRRDSIQFFAKQKILTRHSKQQVEMIEYYLASQAALLKNDIPDIFLLFSTNKSNTRNDKYIIDTGIRMILQFLNQLNDVCEEIGKKEVPYYLSDLVFQVHEFNNKPEITDLIASGREPNTPVKRKLDRFFRKEGSEPFKKLMKIAFELEVFELVAAAAEKYGLAYPQYTVSADSYVHIKGLFHPLVKNAVRNDFNIGQQENLCVVTGANMSGKSTFLKSFGLAVYLAHIGFPVPAEKMETTIFNGLISTINLSDNIEKGYSHFYSEVQRIKHTALKIKERKKIIVIFDELFRGTNVKEAYEASLMVTAAFSKIRSSVFLVSTHIVEIAPELKKYDNISFSCFGSQLNGETPVYSYKIVPGISEDRMGMYILKNENIIEILNQANDA